MALLLGLAALPLRAAPSLTQNISPTDVSVGDEVTVTIAVQNGGGANVELPRVDGLQLAGTSTGMNFILNNGMATSSVSQIFTLVPTRAGDFTIPAFDVHADGSTLHVHEMKIHVAAGGASGIANAPVPNAPGGPVITPPAALAPPAGDATGGAPAADSFGEVTAPPVGNNGEPAKVFLVISPQTTDAYVGQTIPMKIQFFLSLDALAQQDSLPTIEGSDFLMNDLSTRWDQEDLTLGETGYQRDLWMTAISAPRSGDFPLQMVRESYWNKTPQGIFSDPLGNFFSRHTNLAHENVFSNKLMIHVHPLPEEGKPADFSGAIGQFQVTGDAAPAEVSVGEPVYLDFKIAGQGNFNRVKCPVVPADPAWKAYTPSAKTTFQDEARTQGVKEFREALIPQKSGDLKLPDASFSYFDPETKTYATIPIPLPTIKVTGTAVAAAAPGTGAADDAAGTGASAAGPAPEKSGLAPNRLELGATRTDLRPVLWQPWFWVTQGSALAAVLIAAPVLFFASRRRRDEARALRRRQLRTMEELEEAMAAAVQGNDAPALFAAARQAVQLHCASAWGLAPDAVSLPVIAAHDAAMAERLGPLFLQADEVMYSGLAPAGELDLAGWERLVLEEVQQGQLA
jgi:hypothetical protein